MIILQLLVQVIYANHICLTSGNVNVTESRDYSFVEDGYNIREEFVLDPGTEC